MRKHRLRVGRILRLLFCIFCIIMVVYSVIFDKNNSIVYFIRECTLSVQETVYTWQKKGQAMLTQAATVEQLAQQNSDLKLEIAQLAREIDALYLLESENVRLRELLHIPALDDAITLVSTEVIARTLNLFAATLTVDCGSEDGVSIGNLVLNPEGMVGYITFCSEKYAEITTVADADFSVGAMLQRAREVGVLQGDITLVDDGVLQLSLLPTDADVQIGDVVETTGTGGTVPKGVAIGTVQSVALSPDGMTKTALVVPLVDVASAGYVYVVTAY